MLKNMGITLAFLVLLLSAGNAANAMDVVLIMPGGQALTVTIEPENTVAQLKEKVFSASEINPLNQIIYKGKQKLDENRTLSSYSISNGDTLQVMHGVLSAPTRKEKGNGLWIFLTMVVIVGVGVFFMRKKPNREYDGK